MCVRASFEGRVKVKRKRSRFFFQFRVEQTTHKNLIKRRACLRARFVLPEKETMFTCVAKTVIKNFETAPFFRLL